MSALPLEDIHPSQVEAEPPAEPPRRSALLNIQALRALAAFMVIFVHIETLAGRAGVPAAPLETGNAGVDLFFVISGFIMVYTTGRKPTGPLAFLGNRLRRIAPLYWTITLAVFALAMAAPRLLQGTHADPGLLAASLAFIPALRGDGAARPIVFVGWTLNYEMAFYVLFAFGLAFRRRLLGVGVTLALLALAITYGLIAHPGGTWPSFYSQPMIAEFGLGMVLGVVWPRLPASRPLALGFGVIALLAFAGMFAAELSWPHAERALIFGLPAFLILAAALVLERAGLAVRWTWLRKLGDASYAIYLTHFFVTQAATMVAVKLGLHGPAALALCALSITAAGLIGFGVHMLVERPLDRLLGAFAPKAAPTAYPQPVL